MLKTLRIVAVEDDPFDIERIKGELESAGFKYQLTRVQSEHELRRELDLRLPDLILSDHGLPSFDGFSALRIVREKSPDLPFIFVSGSNDQAMIVEMHELGATGYVYKNDIGDLEEAVQAALEPPSVTEPSQLTVELPDRISKTSAPVSKHAHLWFCPVCKSAWDETGKPSRPEEYFNAYDEVIVERATCATCGAR